MLEKKPYLIICEHLKFYKEAAILSVSCLPSDFPSEQFLLGCIWAPGRQG